MEKIKQIIDPIEFPEAPKCWFLIGEFSVFYGLVCQEGLDCGFGIQPGFQCSCHHVPSLLHSLCSLGSFNKQAVGQLWWKKYT